MNVNTCPTPPHPPNVHENARPDKGRAPTIYIIETGCFLSALLYIVIPVVPHEAVAEVSE